MTNLFLVLLSFLAHDVYKKIFFVYEYEAYKSDTGIYIFYAKLIVGDISLFTWRHVRHEQSNGGHVGVPTIPVRKKLFTCDFSLVLQ